MAKVHLHRPSVRTLAVITFVAVALVAGIFYATRQTAKQTYNGQPITYSTDHPDETKPNPKTFVWKGKPTDPKYITLPTIKSAGFIQNVAVDQNKQVGVPNNVHMAGWFTESVLPGQKGLSIIDGHVDGRTDVGIFEKLGKLNKGDQFTVELGNGKVLTYKVVASSTVAVKDAAAVLFSQDGTIASQLNLITCGGTFNRDVHAYDKRVIVSASLI